MTPMRFPATLFETFFSPVPLRAEIDFPEDFLDFVEAEGSEFGGSPKDDPRKRRQGAWSPGLYPPDLGHKRQDALEGVSALVLDYDGTSPGHKELAETWGKYLHLVHSSWSHRPPEDPRYRCILPYSRVVTPEEHKALWAWAQKVDPRIDPACRDPGRIYGIPVVRPGGPPGEVYVHEGPLLNPDDVLPSLPRTERATLRSSLGERLRAIRVSASEPQEEYTLLRENCAWMRRAEENAETLSEPEWYAWLSLLARCRDGEEQAHRIGNVHPGYRPSETEEKFARAAERGPRTCSNLEGLCAEPCKGCAFKGRITSPVQLGRFRGSPPEAVLEQEEVPPKERPAANPEPDADKPADRPPFPAWTFEEGSFLPVPPVEQDQKEDTSGLEAEVAAIEEAILRGKKDLSLAQTALKTLKVYAVGDEVRQKLEEIEELKAAIDEGKSLLQERKRTLVKLTKGAESCPLEAHPATWALLRKDAYGTPLATPDNLDAILRSDPKYRDFWFDAFAFQPYFREAPIGEAFDIRLVQDLARRYRVTFPTDRVVQPCILAIARERARHPVREYLERCYHAWDGEERLGRLLAEGFGVKGNAELAADCGKKFMLSLVRRILNPGEKVDNMLMLSGSQRKKKSKGLRALVSPPEAEKFGGWFSDADINLKDKEGQMLLLGQWLIEMGELESFKGARLTTIKGWLSRQEDRFRPPYGRYVVRRPRSMVCAGTTNEPEFLTDSTGNLRFYAFNVDKVNLRWIEANREQLWGEAVYRVLLGERHWFETDEEHDRLEENNNHFFVQHPWTPILRLYLQRAGRRLVTISELLTKALEMAPDRQTPVERERVTGIIRRQFGAVRQGEKFVGNTFDVWWELPEDFFKRPLPEEGRVRILEGGREVRSSAT